MTHVVTSLNIELREDHQTFFEQSNYKKIEVKLPAEFAYPFAVFMEDGTMMVLWAATKDDLQEWINGFTDTIIDDENGHRPDMVINAENTPIPELNNKNYFVATIYMCLLPEELLRTDLDMLMTSRSLALTEENQVTIEPEVIVSGDRIKGWLTKTVQDVGLF